jgi:hypothetical protein
MRIAFAFFVTVICGAAVIGDRSAGMALSLAGLLIVGAWAAMLLDSRSDRG